MDKQTVPPLDFKSHDFNNIFTFKCRRFSQIFCKAKKKKVVKQIGLQKDAVY